MTRLDLRLYIAGPGSGDSSSAVLWDGMADPAFRMSETGVQIIAIAMAFHPHRDTIGEYVWCDKVPGQAY